MEQYMQTAIARGEIYWIDSNAVNPNGEEFKKTRPGVVVSNDHGNRYACQVVVVYLTTSAKRDLPTHCTIRSANQPSTALCEQPATVHKSRIGDYIGRCTEQEMTSIELCLNIALGLEPAKAALDRDESVEQIEAPTIDTQELASEPTLEDDTEVETAQEDLINSLLAELEKARHEGKIIRELYEGLLDRVVSKRTTERAPIIRA